MLGILLILFVSFFILDVTLLLVAIVPAFIPNFWGIALAMGGPPLFASALILFFFQVSPDLSDAVELKAAYLACFVGFVAGICGHLFIPDYIDLMRTRHVEAVPVAAAREHGGTGYRGYIHGRLLANSTFSHIEKSTNSEGLPTETHYSAAPVAPVPAQADTAIPLFAVAIGEAPFKKWVDGGMPLQGMLVRSDPYHQRTLNLARKAGVRVHPGAVLVRLEERSYMALLESKRTWSWVVMIGANLLWLIIAMAWSSNRMSDIRYASR